MIEKLKQQLEIVLEGDAKNRAYAQQCGVNVEQIEDGIHKLLAQKIVFGSGDQIADMIMAAYTVGRIEQFYATLQGLIGPDELKSWVNQTCIKLGLQTRQLN